MNNAMRVKKGFRNPVVRYGFLDPYRLSNFVVLITGVLLIALVVLDWIFPSGPTATQLGVANADRSIPRAIRVLILVLMLLYIGLTNWDLGAYGFAPGRALAMMALYVLLSVFFQSSELSARFFGFVKSLLWIVAAIVFYRLTIGGYLSAARVRYLAAAVVIIASAYTISFCLAEGRRIGQNANASVLLWCIPLLLLYRPPVWASGLVGLASVAIIVTCKRGAILALLIGGLVFCVISILMSARNRRLRHVTTVMLLVIAIAGGLVWQWENLQYRMRDPDNPDTMRSAHRWFYRAILSKWYDSGLFGLLFGQGFGTVVATLSRYGIAIGAHSDWLGIFHDMGLFGVALFTYLHYRILLMIYSALRQRDPITPALTMGYCTFALRNIYSGVAIGTSDTIYFALLLGYSAAFTASRGL